MHGSLSFDECFGYVPLLGLGGAKKVENLKKVKIREHIELITQLSRENRITYQLLVLLCNL